MRAAPAFELSIGLSRTERALLGALAAVAASALAAWGWSHVDAAVGPAGRGLWPWLVVVTLAGGTGALAGWAAARGAAGTLRWHAGQWTWVEAATAVEHHGTPAARLDLGSWLLVSFAAVDGHKAWFTIARARAAPAWHALRSALFAPDRAAGADLGARTPES